MTEIEQQQLREAIGPRSDYYFAQFEKIDQGAGKWVATWIDLERKYLPSACRN